MQIYIAQSDKLALTKQDVKRHEAIKIHLKFPEPSETVTMSIETHLLPGRQKTIDLDLLPYLKIKY